MRHTLQVPVIAGFGFERARNASIRPLAEYANGVVGVRGTLVEMDLPDPSHVHRVVRRSREAGRHARTGGKGNVVIRPLQVVVPNAGDPTFTVQHPLELRIKKRHAHQYRVVPQDHVPYDDILLTIVDVHDPVPAVLLGKVEEERKQLAVQVQFHAPYSQRRFVGRPLRGGAAHPEKKERDKDRKRTALVHRGGEDSPLTVRHGWFDRHVVGAKWLSQRPTTGRIEYPGQGEANPRN